jgi:hypothetical protein
MGFPTKVQLIQRKASEQYYINFPSALAQAMGFSKGEGVEWIVADKGNLILSRNEVPPNPVDVEKKRRASAQGAFARCSAQCGQIHDHNHAEICCVPRGFTTS